MVTRHTLTLGLVCLLAAPTVLSAQKAHTPAPPAPATSAGVSIAVADFSGQDKELGRFLADTLLTDLAQSQRLHMVERAEIGKALTELRLQSTGLAEPQDVKKVGKLLGADRLIVGSFLARDNQLLVNARLLDVRTGRVTPGGAANIAGKRDDVLRLAHQLANQFHKRVTGASLPLDSENRPPALDPPPAEPMPDLPDTKTPDETPSNPHASDSNSSNANSSSANSNPNSVGNSSDANGNGYNIRQPEANADSRPTATSSITMRGGNEFTPPQLSLPSNIVPSRGVTQSDMRRLLPGAGGRAATGFFTAGGETAPVSRLRALVALVQAGMPSAARVAANPNALASLIPDARLVPAWASGYVVTAIRHGLWPASHALRPLDPANWVFVGGMANRSNLLARANNSRPHARSIPVAVAQARRDVGVSAPSVLVFTPSASPRVAPAVTPLTAFYTGLVIEARDMPVQRAMASRILDTEGNVLYPDPNHVPDIDYLEDHGMADYYHAGVEMPRTGAHPLIVRAVDIAGDDIIVSVETGARIREANRRDGFLRQWRVGILLDEGR